MRRGLNKRTKKAKLLAEEIKLDEDDLRGLEGEVDELEETLFLKMEQSIAFHNCQGF